MNYILKNVDIDRIEETWAIRTVTASRFCHFIILLTDRTHICSCLGLVSRGIVCRHFFQVMLCSRTAVFHITLVHKRWYKEIHSNPQETPYHVATRFDEDNSQLQHQSAELVRHNTIDWFVSPADLREGREDINERKLYGELWGIARDITQRAVRFRRRDILKKLQDLLTEMQQSEQVDNQTDENNTTNNNDENNKENDKENDLSTDQFLQNPKKRKAKGRPKSSKRIKRAEELRPVKHQNQCGNCGERGHYKPKCLKKIS